MGFLRTLLYFLKEGAVAILRHKTLHAFALFIVALSLFVLAFSLYLTGNVSDLIASWQQNLEVRLFLADDLPPSRAGELAARFSADPRVLSVRAVSAAEALEELARISPAFGSAAAALDENPLPPSLSLRLRPPVDLNKVRLLLEEARRLDGVDQVLFDWDWVEKLRDYNRFVRLLGGLLFAALSAAAVFTMAAVTRIIALSRKEEIAILRFVGATEWSLRGPFVAGGLILGGLAALLALAGLYAAHLLFFHFAKGGALFLGYLSRRYLTPSETLLVLSLGMALSALGGGLSLRLEEHRA
ncbi:MAG: cell division protein FtsX [Acidobacteriota bacterium]